MTRATLSTVGFIAGRLARVDDINQGVAVFCQQAGGGQSSASLKFRCLNMLSGMRLTGLTCLRYWSKPIVI